MDSLPTWPGLVQHRWENQRTARSLTSTAADWPDRITKTSVLLRYFCHVAFYGTFTPFIRGVDGLMISRTKRGEDQGRSNCFAGGAKKCWLVTRDSPVIR